MTIPWPAIPFEKVVCLYEVLGLSPDCSGEEIRSAYKKLALQRHPDKLVQTGEPKIEAEATAAFQELQNAYEILSDTKQRSLYDYHRNRFKTNLNRDSKAETSSRDSNKEETSDRESKNSENKESSGFIPLREEYNLKEFSFVNSVNLGYFANSVYCFYAGYSDSGKGFYKVYGDMFKKIYNNEVDFLRRFHMPLPREGPPPIGNLKSSDIQVVAFYKYWYNFATCLEFYIPKHEKNVHPDELVYQGKMSPRHKRMEEKARKNYNASVRTLAKFVKERDIRVIEMEERLEDERARKREEKKLAQLKDLERLKKERAMNNSKEVKVKPVHIEEDEEEDLVDEKELYCVICGKDFKNIKQRKEHDKSMEHKQQMEEWWELVDDVEEENQHNAI